MLDVLDLADFIGRRRRALAELGVTLETRRDFERLQALDLPGKTLSPMFAPRHYDLLDQRARWICGWMDGEIVHIQAIRLIDTGEASLEDALRSEFARIFGPPEAGAVGPIAEALTDIRGRVVYHGELWTDRRLRGTGAGETLGALGLGAALAEFDPDYLVGFMEQPLAARGFFLREGYFHIEPVGSGWRRGAPFLLESDWVVYAARADLRKLVRRDAQQNRVMQPVSRLEPMASGNTSR